jgi:hypothetical protein
VIDGLLQRLAHTTGKNATDGTMIIDQWICFTPGASRSFLDWLASNPFPAHAQPNHEEIEASVQAECGAWD